MTDLTTKSPISLDGNTLTIGEDTAQKLFGSSSQPFVLGLAKQLVNAVSKGNDIDNQALTSAGAMMEGINPRDELEAMLALQIVAIHNATMTFARQLARVENIPQQDSAEKALNKLARTFTMQMQTLQKYRSGGKQKVTVKHVHVNEGGQAIVGNVEAGVGRGKK